jgi:hypothetical protein
MAALSGKRFVCLLIVMPLFCLFACIGCDSTYQSYSGPKKPYMEVAYLKSTNPDIYLYAIDDKNRYEAQYGYNESKRIGTINVALLPGEHEIELCYGGVYLKNQITRSVSSKSSRLYGKIKGIFLQDVEVFQKSKKTLVKFTAEAGKTYWIHEKNKEISISSYKINDINEIETTQREILSYEEPAGSDNEVAVLKVKGSVLNIKGSLLSLHAVIFRVDNCISKSGSQYFNSDWDGSLTLKLKPGKHTLTLAAYDRTYIPRENAFLTADFEAGKTYSFDIKKVKSKSETVAIVKLLEDNQ